MRPGAIFPYEPAGVVNTRRGPYENLYYRNTRISSSRRGMFLFCFRNHMPYGAVRDVDGSWVAFNRGYDALYRIDRTVESWKLFHFYDDGSAPWLTTYDLDIYHDKLRTFLESAVSGTLRQFHPVKDGWPPWRYLDKMDREVLTVKNKYSF